MALTTEMREYHRQRYLVRRDALLKTKRDTYDPKEERRKNLWRYFKITPAEYDMWLEKQYGRCAICSTDKPHGRWSCFVVDHDHDTNAIRGLLCGKCNVGLGALGDNEAGLLKALAYVRGQHG